jgi:hypothetical protein
MRITGIGRLGFSTFALAALILGGCSDSGKMVGSSNTGRVRMIMGGPRQAATGGVAAATALNDGTGRTLTAAEITVSSVLARNLDGQLIDVTMDLPATVDLVALIGGGTTELPIGALPVGTYDQLVVVIRSLHVELSDGTQVDVTPPGGGWTAIVNTDAFDVVDGQVTTVTLHFRANGAFQFVNGHLEFTPGFDCEHDHDHDGHDGENDDDNGDDD